MVQLRYTVNGDNGPTDPNLPDFVKSWNEKYVSPKLIISTTSEMFSHFEKKYGSVLPHYSGDFSPYWEDGALSTACELALTRNASERLVQAEILYSLAAPEKYNSKVFDEAWKNILLFDEHTWGAWNSISDPDAASVTQQWKIKQKFALNADSLSKAMLNNFIPGTRNFEIPESLEVINTNSWPRTDIVITRERTAGKNIVITGEDGNEVPSQLLSDGRVAFLASSVPPLGSKLYYVKEKSGSPQGVNINGEFPGFYNSNIRIVIDSITGNIKSILYKGNNLVNTSELNGLNEYLYIQGTDPDNRLTGNMPYISVKEDGPLLATIDICSDAAGCRHLDREVTLLKPFDRIDIRNTLDKEKVRDKEAVHFAFPFNITGGMLKYDLGWGTVTPGKDQLAGSCQDFWPVQRWLDISNEEFGITLSVNETPLIEPGSMTDETRNNNGYRRWKKIPSSSLILFMYVMNNYWHTNYKADQEGKVVFNYSLLLHGKSGISEANRFGIERSQPLIIRQASPGNYLSTSLFTINSTDVIVTSVKPVDKGKALIARLYNAGDTKAEITITPKDKGKSVYLSSPFEENGKMLNLIKLEPNEILTVKIQ
jgi:alpha-mannosidase